MSYNKKDSEINYEQIEEFLKTCVQQVKTQEDVEVLNQLKKIFKHNVPFTLRGYVSAYLLKLASGSARRQFSSRKDVEKDSYRHDHERSEYTAPRSEERRDNARQENGRHERRHTRVEIDPSVAATIFISIGRNRRVFPRDLLGLLINVAGLERERVGDIRVLANYSFIQLFAEDADKAISALNGYSYRGKPISVSYSRKADYDSTDDFAEDSSPSAQDSANQDRNESADVNAAENISAAASGDVSSSLV